MKFTKDGGTLTLFLQGRIDSSSAAQRTSEAEAVIAENAPENVILDAEELEDISSAGLRMVLKLRKAFPELKIMNVSSEIYEILDMTGFTEMIAVEKAYRRLSVDGCEVIGQGANGMVYRLDPDTIIKVYRNPDSLPDIQRERELARKAFVLGVPTAIPYDVVKVGDGYGSVFELLNAKSFAGLMNEAPEKLEDYIGMSVELLKKIHGTVVKPEDMPDEKKVVQSWVSDLEGKIPDDQYARLKALVDAVPEDHHMMHGDYHIKNVMLQNGEVLLIDMDTLCQGYPVFEFASIYLAYVGFSEIDPENIRRFLGIPLETGKKIWERTLALYFGTEDPAILGAAADKARVVGYTRLLRRTMRRTPDTEEGRAIIANCRKQLAELLDRVDSLLF